MLTHNNDWHGSMRAWCWTEVLIQGVKQADGCIAVGSGANLDRDGSQNCCILLSGCAFLHFLYFSSGTNAQETYEVMFVGFIRVLMGQQPACILPSSCSNFLKQILRSVCVSLSTCNSTSLCKDDQMPSVFLPRGVTAWKKKIKI